MASLSPKGPLTPNKRRRVWIIVVGCLVAVAWLVYVARWAKQAVRWTFGDGCTTGGPADVCKTIADRSFRNMTCSYYGEHAFSVSCNAYKYFRVIGPGFTLSGSVGEYAGEELRGLSCVDRRRKMAIFFDPTDPPIPPSSEGATAARELCALLDRR